MKGNSPAVTETTCVIFTPTTLNAGIDFSSGAAHAVTLYADQSCENPAKAGQIMRPAGTEHVACVRPRDFGCEDWESVMQTG